MTCGSDESVVVCIPYRIEDTPGEPSVERFLFVWCCSASVARALYREFEEAARSYDGPGFVFTTARRLRVRSDDHKDVSGQRIYRNLATGSEVLEVILREHQVLVGT